MFTLKPFQETAIAQLKEKFLTLWKLGDHNLNLTFKSPTGSGKTIMMAEFLAQFADDETLPPCAFIWTAPRQLHEQSKEKLAYLFQTATLSLSKDAHT